MKHTLLIAAFVAAGLGANAQTTNPAGTGVNQSPTQTTNMGANYVGTPYDKIPKNVQTTFGTAYPGITTSKWESSKTGYRTNFQQNGRDTWVTYDLQGNQQEIRSSMSMDALPLTVQSTLKGQEANYPYEVKVGNETYYTAKVKNKDMYYDINGNAMKPPKRKK